jgi:hypothetical protein
MDEAEKAMLLKKRLLDAERESISVELELIEIRKKKPRNDFETPPLPPAVSSVIDVDEVTSSKADSVVTKLVSTESSTSRSSVKQNPTNTIMKYCVSGPKPSDLSQFRKVNAEEVVSLTESDAHRGRETAKEKSNNVGVKGEIKNKRTCSKSYFNKKIEECKQLGFDTSIYEKLLIRTT